MLVLFNQDSPQSSDDWVNMSEPLTSKQIEKFCLLLCIFYTSMHVVSVLTRECSQKAHVYAAKHAKLRGWGTCSPRKF